MFRRRIGWEFPQLSGFLADDRNALTDEKASTLGKQKHTLRGEPAGKRLYFLANSL